MKIVSSETSSIDIRLTESLTTAAGGIGDRGGIRLTIATDSSITGMGETAPIPGIDGPRLEAIASEIDAWSSTAVDLTIDDALEGLDDESLSPLARFAVHTALVDAASQHRGVPLSQWLRAGAAAVVRVNGLVTESNPGAVHGRVSELVSEGIRSIKLKVGAEEPARDVTRIIAASEAAGPAVELRLDANRAWDAATVARVVGRVGKHRIAYIEDPTPVVSEYRAIQDTVDVLVALDLPITDSPQDEVERAGVSIVVVKPAAVGGVDRVMDLARTLADSRIDSRIVVSSSIDREVALAAAVHAAAALPNSDEAHGLAIGSMVRNLPGVLVSAGATLAVPSEPGVYRPEDV